MNDWTNTPQNAKRGSRCARPSEMLAKLHKTHMVSGDELCSLDILKIWT